MAKNLVIVESPAKAKTIEKILGKDFKVKSSMGHIRDLDKGDKGVDVKNKFEPTYVVSPEKKNVVKELKDSVKKVDEVWLATDEDREGEAISWHLCEVLGLDLDTTKRIVFREITKPAILKAVQNPRTVDKSVVNAQQARRILDRLVGFELSGLLWKKVKGKLSAGRVQSVTVKLIVERERQIQNFEATAFYRVVAEFIVKNESGKEVKLKAELPERFQEEGEAVDFLEKCKDSVFTIENITKKPLTRKPAAPFTTSTLQQEASRKLGFGVKRTMMNAQRLYEQGLITYMRTDSTTLSQVALNNIAAEIKGRFGQEYVETRQYANKRSNAQEAHEAIRPSYIEKDRSGVSDRDQARLYELIWKRTIASQMSNAKLEKTIVDIDISKAPDKKLRAQGEVLKFDGFLKVYLESKDDDEGADDQGILPPLTVGQVLNLDFIKATERFTKAPARYTEASLVKKLEELGIGRPSTYAPTISKIMEPNRGYVVKESRDGKERTYSNYTLQNGKIDKTTLSEVTGATKNRLYSTDIGMVVSDFLSKHFQEVMDYGFTADIERQFDFIAAGEQEWKEMLDSFYDPFHATVVKTTNEADRAVGERILGTDPESGRTVLVRISRYGSPIVQLGKPDELDEDEKPKYGNLKKEQSIESISFEEAMKLFGLPKQLEEYEGKEVVVNNGRYGPYVKWGDAFISLPKGEEPLTVNQDRAVELIEEKKKADAPIATYKGESVTKGKGRFGPFLKWKDLYVNVPRRYDFENLKPEEIFELVSAKIEKERLRIVHKWEELEMSVEMGRWGPFIKYKKQNINIPKVDGKRVTRDEALEMNLDEFKVIVKANIPDAFEEPKTKKKAKKK